MACDRLASNAGACILQKHRRRKRAARTPEQCATMNAEDYNAKWIERGVVAAITQSRFLVWSLR